MIWVAYAAFVCLVAVVAYFADSYARKHKLGTYAKRKLRRHANTGEFKIIKHDLPHELSYNTADIPKVPVQTQVQAGLDYIERRYGPLPALAGRTDTVMAEAIDPSQYPEWAR